MKFSPVHNLIVSIVFILIISIPGFYTLITCREDSLSDTIEFCRNNYLGKNYILNNYINFKYYMLHESPIPERVILGKEGWLFLGDSFDNGHSISLGLSKFSTNDLEKIAKNIKDKKEFLDAHNIKFYVAIAPNKQSVYDEYLMEGKYDQGNNVQLLKTFMKSRNNFKLIDLKEAIDPIKDSIQLYYKTDTHWNGIGAYWAFKAISDNIKKDFPKYTFHNISDYKVRRDKFRNFDLSAMLKLNIAEDQVILEPKFEVSGIDLKPKLEIPSRFRMNKTFYEKRYYNNKKELKILIFRDSFTTALLPYFKENFLYSEIIWDFDFDKKMILAEKPDIVLYIVAERLISAAFLE